MLTVADYHRQAQSCLRLARPTNSRELSMRILDLATEFSARLLPIRTARRFASGTHVLPLRHDELAAPRHDLMDDNQSSWAFLAPRIKRARVKCRP
jgi:hypothetical protein